jgi:[glutamine synthetase] adenylyltransferase / [glutamine synthetase]-adenylyl-L-tyrosine phosphorylase
LPAADAATLQNAARLYHRLTQILRLCVEEDYDPANAPAGLNRAVALAAECPDMRSAEAALRHMQMAVADIFDRLVGDPTKI